MDLCAGPICVACLLAFPHTKPRFSARLAKGAMYCNWHSQSFHSCRHTLSDCSTLESVEEDKNQWGKRSRMLVGRPSKPLLGVNQGIAQTHKKTQIIMNEFICLQHRMRRAATMTEFSPDSPWSKGQNN